MLGERTAAGGQAAPRQRLATCGWLRAGRVHRPGIAALATADDAERWAGTIISSRQLADAYGVTDTDGSEPDCWGYLAAYGWEREDGDGIDRFRCHAADREAR